MAKVNDSSPPRRLPKVRKKETNKKTYNEDVTEDENTNKGNDGCRSISQLEGTALGSMNRLLKLCHTDEERELLFWDISTILDMSIHKPVNGLLTQKTLGEAILSGTLLIQSLKYIITVDPSNKASTALFGLHIISIILQILTIILLITNGVLNYDRASIAVRLWLHRTTLITLALITIIIILCTVITGLEPIAYSCREAFHHNSNKTY